MHKPDRVKVRAQFGYAIQGPSHQDMARLLISTLSPSFDRRAWWTLFVLTLTYVFAYVDRQLLAVLAETIRHDIGLTDTQLAMLLGLAFAIFYTSVGLVAGTIADRGNRRLLLVSGSSIWSLATAAGALAGNFRQLLMARLGVGFGESCLNPTALSLLGDVFPRHLLGRAMGIYALGIAIGGGIATAVGGMLMPFLLSNQLTSVPFLGVMRPWQLVMFAVGSAGLVCPLLLLTVPNAKRSQPIGDAGETPVTWRNLFAFLRRNAAVYTGLCWPMAAGALLMIAIGSWIPTFFARNYGLGPEQLGAALRTWGIIFLTGNAAGTLVGGFLADRLLRCHIDGHLRALLYAFLIAGPSYVLFPMMPTPGLAILLLAPAVFGSGMLQACGPAAMLAVTPHRVRARISAIYFLTMNVVGAALGPSAVAFLTGHVFGGPQHLATSLVTVAAVAGTSAILALIMVSGRYKHMLASGETS